MTEPQSESLPPAEQRPQESQNTSGEDRGSRTALIVLAVLLIGLIIVVGLALAGVIGGSSEPAPPQASDPFVQISAPTDGAVLDIAEPVTVSGQGGGLFEGNVVVQVLDAEGNVLAQEPTTIGSPEAGTGGAGPWTVDLTIETPPGTPGDIRAFSPSPADGSDLAADSVSVIFGEAEAAEPAIGINEPSDGATVDISAPVRVSGLGRALFEGNVVVQALDGDGNVLAQEPTIVDAPDAGTGGEGPWSVELSIDVASGTVGRITAFSPSPQDGSVTASDEVNVTYESTAEATATPPEEGSEVGLEDALWLLISLDRNGVIEDTRITADFKEGQLNGLAGCNNYFSSYEVSGSNLTIGAIGTTQKFCAEPEGTMNQESSYLGALEATATFSIPEGQLNLMDESGSTRLVYNAAVVGTITSPSTGSLPENTTVTVQLQDVSLADAPAKVLGEQVIQAGGASFPIPFAVTYDPTQIDPRNTYSISVWVEDASGSLLFINMVANQVITGGNPSELEVVVEPI